MKCRRESYFTKEQLKCILKKADELRLSKEVQVDIGLHPLPQYLCIYYFKDEMSVRDDMEINFAVTKNIYINTIREYNVDNEAAALDEGI